MALVEHFVLECFEARVTCGSRLLPWLGRRQQALVTGHTSVLSASELMKDPLVATVFLIPFEVYYGGSPITV